MGNGVAEEEGKTPGTAPEAPAKNDSAVTGGWFYWGWFYWG